MKRLFVCLTIFSLFIIAPPASANRNYQLKIVYRESAVATAVSWNLTCRPAGGPHPAAKLACAELRSDRNPFLRPAPDEACTMIYGGEQQAKVTGRWAGKKVNRKFTRTNGCEIDRWEQLSITLSGKQSS
ncbi:MAG: hypothetical protein RIT32_72 [Actinomycetota bacterium]|jgi:hypothetical protein